MTGAGLYQKHSKPKDSRHVFDARAKAGRLAKAGRKEGMKEITYIAKGSEHNFTRCGDHLERVTLCRTWETGGLLYGYRDRFNVVCIPKEDIVSIIENR